MGSRTKLIFGIFVLLAAGAAFSHSWESYPTARVQGVSPEGYVVECCDCDQDCEPKFSPDLPSALEEIERCLDV